MYQSVPHCPSSAFNAGYGSHHYHGGVTSCSHGHAHGPSDMPLMSINLEFGSDIGQQPRSNMMPVHGDRLHFRFKCDQPYLNPQPTSYIHDNIGRQHCCCHHGPPQHTAPAPKLMHHQPINYYPLPISHPYPMNHPQGMNHLPTMNHPHPMNNPGLHPQPMNLQINHPQPMSNPINHPNLMNPLHHPFAPNPPQGMNHHQKLNHFQGNIHAPLPSAIPYPPQKQQMRIPSVPSTANCANININIGGVTCIGDQTVAINPNNEARNLWDFGRTLDKKIWRKPGIPEKLEPIPTKSVPVNDEYRNSLSAITRSHAEWLGHSSEGSSPVDSNSLFDPTFPQNSDGLECPWLPSNLDDKDFRLVLFFLQKSKQLIPIY